MLEREVFGELTAANMLKTSSVPRLQKETVTFDNQAAAQRGFEKEPDKVSGSYVEWVQDFARRY